MNARKRQSGAFARGARGLGAWAGLFLFLAGLLPAARTSAQGIWIATQADPAEAVIGQRVTLRGYLFSLAEGFEDFLFAVDARFVIHHGSGTVSTTNLLAEPQIIRSWEGLLVETHFQVQAFDPAYLRVDFVAVLTPYWSQPHYFTNVYPCQVHVADAVPPRLTIAARAAGMLALTWPGQYAEWVLESSPGLGQPWQAVGASVLRENDQCAVLVPRSAGQQRLFRLRR
jgi:hypothetical protein